MNDIHTVDCVLCQEYGYIHLSAGELLRAERKKSGSEVGLLIEKHIQEGSIVPVEITCRLLQQVTLHQFCVSDELSAVVSVCDDAFTQLSVMPLWIGTLILVVDILNG